MMKRVKGNKNEEAVRKVPVYQKPFQLKMIHKRSFEIAEEYLRLQRVKKMKAHS